MNNLFFKISMVIIAPLSFINTSYAETTCYQQIPSLNLSTTEQNKNLCEQKKFETEVSGENTQKTEIKAEDSKIGMDAYFVYPHIENEEKGTDADGIGASISVNF
ncbi:MAG: hypothetical protein GQ581_09395 [Methyloprofundus sp.]|nr:hypothetical protein [Methyloprofundus sp.]